MAEARFQRGEVLPGDQSPKGPLSSEVVPGRSEQKDTALNIECVDCGAPTVDPSIAEGLEAIWERRELSLLLELSKMTGKTPPSTGCHFSS